MAAVSNQDTPVVTASRNAPARLNAWAWGVAAGLVVATVALLIVEGQRWWCSGGEAFLWSGDVWSRHNSQHMVDPYSFTHVMHGLIFAVLFTHLPPFRKWSPPWRLCLALAVEALWEVAENTPWVINHYRETTMALGYEGDSIANSLGDIACSVLGNALAARLGWRWSTALFVATELILLAMIRDNLSLNVLMLLWLVEAIKQWQTAGQG